MSASHILSLLKLDFLIHLVHLRSVWWCMVSCVITEAPQGISPQLSPGWHYRLPRCAGVTVHLPCCGGKSSLVL